MELYDSIGHGYPKRRQPDPRIAVQILRALGNAASVVNVGAGTGSYEPCDRQVVAVEPSKVMIRQRASNAAPVVQASATHLPFRDASVDASLAVLTIHHWPDLPRGLQELRRIARQTVVILTFDTSAGWFWLADYFPEMSEIDRQSMPSLAEIQRHLGDITVFDVPVPHDCKDGFLGAYWRRPHAYLDVNIRSSISLFSKLKSVETRLAALRADLDSGAWYERYQHLLDRSELDIGYRLITAKSPNSAFNGRRVADNARR